MLKLIVLACLVSKAYGNSAPLKPLSACCDIPDLGNPKLVSECTQNSNNNSHCEKIECQFEKHGFLHDQATLNKEAYQDHLKQWADTQKGADWKEAVNKAIQDCVDKELRQYSKIPCKSYDVFACTTIAMLKKCPKEAWKC